MKVLITGSAGFIGTHLTREMQSAQHEVLRCDLKAADDIVSMDILNQEQTESILRQYKPDAIINLAGQADVGLSWKKPQLTFQLNTIGLINILEAVKNVDQNIRVIAIGSSDEYGKLKTQGINVTEETPVHPATPYAISKYAQELFSELYVRSNEMDVCLIRLFNLGGAGQGKGFMISDFASGVAEAEAGLKDHMTVGNLEASRDFTHVKDACRAMRLIAEKGIAGEVYNICSGTVWKAGDVLEKLLDMAERKIEVVPDPLKMRPSDTPVVCGNHDKLTLHTGWEPQLEMEVILQDALNDWRSRIRNS